MGWIITGKAMHQNTDSFCRTCPTCAKHKFHIWITEWHWVPASSSL